MPESLWYPGAVRWPGNPNVTGYPPSIGGLKAPKRGAVEHSAEGVNWGVIHDLLLTKSWHATIGYDRIEQHHPIDINCWHGADTDADGGVRANIDLIGVEHLGVAGHPLTEYQIQATVDFNRWAAAQFGLATFSRYPKQDGWTMAEHNEVSNTYTACPSSRIPWAEVMKRLQEDDVTPQDLAAIKAMLEASEKDVKEWVTKEMQAVVNAMVLGFKNIDGDTEKIKAKLGI